MTVEDTAEKKRLVGYWNPRKIFDPEPKIPCFALAIFTDAVSIPDTKFYLQSIKGSRIAGFYWTDFPRAVIEQITKEVYLGIGDTAITGFDFSPTDTVRGSLNEVAVAVKKRLREILPYEGIHGEVMEFLREEGLLP